MALMAVLIVCPLDILGASMDPESDLTSDDKSIDDRYRPMPSMPGPGDRPLPPEGRPVPPGHEHWETVEFLEKPLPMQDVVPGILPPPSDVPYYDHDVEDEDILSNLDPMINGDINMFDPGFVEDAISFVEKHGMKRVADVLRVKLAEMIESNTLSSACLGLANTRASGIDDEIDDDTEIVIVEEEEESADGFLFYDNLLPNFFDISSSSVISQDVFLLLL